MMNIITALLLLIVTFSACGSMGSEAAEEALMAGDTEGALAAYMEVLSNDPDDAESLELAVMLASEAGVPELGAELLRAEIERALVLGDKARVQQALTGLGELNAMEPPWVESRFFAAAAIKNGQAEDFQAWQELNAEGQVLLEAGDFESAMTVLEGAMLLAQEVFGAGHWLTIAATRDMGFAARQLGDVQAADSLYNEALAMSMESLGEAHPRTQEIAGLMAELYGAAGANDEAIAIREMITANFDAALGPDHALTLASLFEQAVTIRAAGDNESARGLLTFVCGSYARAYSPYHSATLECETYLGRLHRESGDLEEAEKLFMGVEQDIARSSDVITPLAIDVMMQLGDLYWQKGEFVAGKDLLSSAVLTARQMGLTDLSYIGKTYLARILASEGEVDDAAKVTEAVVSFGRTAWADRPVQYYNVFLELGALYQRQSRFSEAEKIFEEAMLALLEVVGEYHPSTLVAMNNLGNLYEQMGLYDDAEPILKQTLAGMEATFGVAHTQTARTRNNLALLHESQGNFREAEPLYNTSYEHVVDALGENHPDAIAMQNNLAFLYMMMEEYDAAAPLFEDLVERWRIVVGPEHQDALKSLNNLGRVYYLQGRLDEAEQVVLQALSSRRSKLGEKHIDTIRSMIDLGAIYLEQGRLEEAARELSLALSTAEMTIGEQHPYTFEALNNLAKVREAEGNLSEAVDLREIGLARRSVFLDRMLWVTGENAREGYIRLHRPELDAYLTLLTRIDDPERGKKAIEASLQRKGLLLKITSEIEQIAQMSNDPRLSVISAELEAARKQLASLTLSGPVPETQGRHAEALYDLESKVNELQGELGRASVRYRSSIAGASADTLASSLAENTALVDFLMYNEGEDPRVLAGVIMNNDGEITFDLVEFPDRDEIESSVINYRTIIQDDLADEVEVMDFGQLAYELVWSPVTDVIGDMDYVYLIPDGVLNILPFNALMDADERYLIQDTDLHILTSGRDLLPNDYELAEGQYVILAGPDYNANNVIAAEELEAAAGRRSAALKLGIRSAGGGLRGLNFAPLPGAEEEGRIITEQVEANDEASQVYFGETAQEQVLANISETPEILHMATHGFFLEADDSLRKRLLKLQRSSEVQVPPPGDNPLLRAGLAFAGINTNARFLGDIDTVNDGVLTALEVLGLDLSGTRLVVLSACETGLGEIHEGEGVYGLRRSFQEAGVAEVVSSLWEVSDAGTQALMTDFYERVLEGTPAREALRETQLAMLDSPQWGYPYIWSAFMIVGSYESAGYSIQ